MIARQMIVKNYNDLYNYVKDIKNRYNLEGDTSEIVDELIYRWFSQKGINGLDVCYHKFNEKLEEDEYINIRVEEKGIKADWE
ncbi:MAG: hypothetical protein ACOC4G_04240 [Bacillota bacterium]